MTYTAVTEQVVENSKIANFRQPVFLSELIEISSSQCVKLPLKIHKKSYNRISIAALSVLDDFSLDVFITNHIYDMYDLAFTMCGYSKTKSNELFASRRITTQTTVDLSGGISALFENLVERIGKLPSSNNLKDLMESADINFGDRIFTSTDVRLKAILYFAGLTMNAKETKIKQLIDKFPDLFDIKRK